MTLLQVSQLMPQWCMNKTKVVYFIRVELDKLFLMVQTRPSSSNMDGVIVAEALRL